MSLMIKTLLYLSQTLILLFLFCQSAYAQLRPMVYTDKVVSSDVETVWEDWTTAEGLESFFAPKAIVDGTLGGAYEVWFLPDAPKGQRGAEDGILLAWQTDSANGARMIQFTWRMPPYMPEIVESMTVVQIWMVPMGEDKTRLRLFHTGFGDTPQWLEARDYFQGSWSEVLKLYHAHIEKENKG